MGKALNLFVLGLVSLIAIFFTLALIRTPSLRILFLKPGMVVAPLIVNIIPSQWGSGENGENGRLLFVAVVNLSALAIWWLFFSVGFYIYFARRPRPKVNA